MKTTLKIAALFAAAGIITVSAQTSVSVTASASASGSNGESNSSSASISAVNGEVVLSETTGNGQVGFSTEPFQFEQFTPSFQSFTPSFQSFTPTQPQPSEPSSFDFTSFFSSFSF